MIEALRASTLVARSLFAASIRRGVRWADRNSIDVEALEQRHDRRRTHRVVGFAENPLEVSTSSAAGREVDQHRTGIAAQRGGVMRQGPIGNTGPGRVDLAGDRRFTP